MKNKRLTLLIQIVALTSIFIGFRLATQAGQDMAMPQNDGYAMSGGLLIFLGGLLLGSTLRYGYQKRGKK